MDKRTVLSSIQADFLRFHQDALDSVKSIKKMEEEGKQYIRDLLSQITTTGAINGALLGKTPKVTKKKPTKIKAIPENEEMEDDGSFSNLSTRSSRVSRADAMALETSELRPTRSKRGASVKAAGIIKKQQSISLSTKLRRPSNEGSDVPLASRIIKESTSKRPKESLASSEDEDIRPVKQSKLEKKKLQSTCIDSDDEDENIKPVNHNKIEKKKMKSRRIESDVNKEINDTISVSERNETVSLEKSNRASVKRKLEEDDDADTTLISEHSTRRNSISSDEPAAKKANYSKSSSQKTEKHSRHMNTLERISEKSTSNQNGHAITRVTRSSTSSVINAQSKKPNKANNIINETVDADETVASMYEDAIGKPIPIMNSTMNPNTTVTLEKMMNATVVLEPLSSKKIFNETITIKKNSFKEPRSRNNSNFKEKSENDCTYSIPKEKSPIKKAATIKSKKDLKLEDLNELITDDESSPERKEYRMKKEKQVQKKRVTISNCSQSDDDIVLQTPNKINQQNKDAKTGKSTYKQVALFSPYAKESVKKRVEAFEQAVGSPKASEETGGRVTRTKTRALAAASFTEASAPVTVAQKLAKKSLAKAKRISLARLAKVQDDTKENDNANTVKSTKKSSSEKPNKNSLLKTTPLGKSRLQMPSSVNKNIYTTPSNSNTLNTYSKGMTGTRGNIVTHVDSFIQPMKSASKQIDRVAEEKRRRAHEEDARRKREELLKAQAEEKRRKREEKELKNKLAREAKEKLEYEKRLKAEREKEEKARLAQLLQEKQREELEKKRVAQIQRAQEKEERRKQEELLRLQRLQEQEEQERLLAEQRRREQEMEKRKQAEFRHMAEMKLKSQQEAKAQMLAKSKATQAKQATYNYKIDSDPDEEESDDESKPKHQIAHWASKHVRQTQLAMQQYIPMKLALKFFDAKKCTPDLRDLFQGIDPQKLKRSSSAIWKTPPRYSMMNRSIMND